MMQAPFTRRRAALAALLLALAAAAPPAWALGLNAKLNAMVMQPSGPPTRQEFDLTPAANRARAENKWLYVYLGASDCKYCREYEAFVDKNIDALLPHFGKYLVVDLRSSLATTADKLYIRIGATSLPYAEFQRSIGDERARLLVYPSVWLFGTDMKPLMQMPAGNGTFQTVPEQIEILKLQQ